MNFWERVTGSDMTREMRGFEERAGKLPAAYQETWEEIVARLWGRSDFTGRNLMPILDGVLELLESAAADGRGVDEVLGSDVAGFCTALADEEGAPSMRDKQRAQLNAAVARKLGNLGGE